MTSPVMLNFEEHKHTHVIATRGEEFGDNVHLVPVTVRELKKLVLEFPVLLVKNNETGQFELSALLGFEPGENLFLQGHRWSANYVPLHLQRQPFMVGLRNSSKDAEQREAVITIDMDSNRIASDQGEALFRDNGENTEYLDKVTGVLSELMSATELTQSFLQRLVLLGLVEPANFEITFESGDVQRYGGFYTVNSGKLAQLAGDELQDLHGAGFLEACHLLSLSLGHINKLISLKTQRKRHLA